MMDLSNILAAVLPKPLNVLPCSGDSRPMENRPPSPMFFKVKKTHEVSVPSQNGELSHQRSERKQLGHSLQSQQSQSTSSDAGGSESEGGSLPPPFPDEDPERMKHSKITVCLSECHGLNASL